MDLNIKTNKLTEKVGPNTKLVTIRSLVTIMVFLKSPAFHHLHLESLTDDLKDTILDGLKTGLYAEDLGRECDDDDCCSQKNKDLQQYTNMPQDEKMCRHHLLRAEFGQKVLHRLVLRAATLDLSFIGASMPSNGATTSLHQHFQLELVNVGIKECSRVLLEGGEPQLLQLPPPAEFQVRDPDFFSRSRRWEKPWERI